MDESHLLAAVSIRSGQDPALTRVSQEYVDAEEDAKSNKGKQSDGYEEGVEDVPVATGGCQHNGHSLSTTGALAKRHQPRLRWARKIVSEVRKSS